MSIADVSGRLQTVTLKAEPAKTKAKVPGAVKGSWGKAAPAKGKTEAAAAPAQSTVNMYKVDRI